MAGFGDDSDQDNSDEEQYTDRLIPDGIGEDFNQDQCHLPSSRYVQQANKTLTKCFCHVS